MNARAPVLLGWLAVIQAPVFAASFDCAKAKTPLEKLICSNPELDTADAQMGAAYKALRLSFPNPVFVTSEQQYFVSSYPSCLEAEGRTLNAAEAVRSCLALVKKRISVLEAYRRARVFSHASRPTHETLTVLLYSTDGRERIRLWGNWMPNAFDRKPFPDGFRCDIDADLVAVNGGYEMTWFDEVFRFKITDGGVELLDKRIQCSMRTYIVPGKINRIK